MPPISKELRQEIRARREPPVLLAGKLVPGSVAFLREMLTKTADDFERDDLLGEIAGEYLRAELEDDHVLVQRERLRNHPEAAVKWLGLADALSSRADGANEAKQAAAKGVEISRSVGTLIRYALTCQAQVARKTGDASLFEQAMIELVQDAPNERQEDCALFESLIVDLPPGFCAPHIVQSYKQALEYRGT